jgi:hypothetical protein
MAKRGRRKGGARSAASGGIDLMRYAAEGARARLQALAREAGELIRHFPQLRTESAFPWVGAGGKRTRASAAPGTRTVRRRKRKMSAEGRARISAAQKKRWAEQRKRQGQKQK